jgi:uncharacterized protein (DUF3084 family)
LNVVSGFFLIIMSLAGGLVAMIADRLGRTLGKKRLTLLGMRPRHTATTITVVAGMLIPLITVGVVAALSAETRQWIVEGPDAIRKNRQLLKDISSLEKQKEKASSDLLIVEKQVSDAEAKLRDANVKLKQLAAAVNRFQSQVLALQKKVVEKQSAVDKAQAALVRADRVLAQRTREFASLSSTYRTLQANHRTLTTSYKELDNQRAEAFDERERLLKLNEQVSNDNKKLASLNTSLGTEISEKTKALQQTQSQLEFAKLNLDKTQADLRRAIAQQTLLAQRSDSNLITTRLTPAAFGIGDELARISIPANSDASAVRGLYATLLKQALQVAIQRGAKASQENDAAYPLFIDTKGAEIPRTVREQEIFKEVTGGKEGYVLIATSQLNTFKGESVPLDIQPSSNPIVYRQGERIGELMVNGNLGEDEIFQNITDFLARNVRPKALNDQMIRVAGHEESFGEVPVTKLLEVALSIRQYARPIRLAIIAESDTRRGDPLRLDFRVR